MQFASYKLSDKTYLDVDAASNDIRIKESASLFVLQQLRLAVTTQLESLILSEHHTRPSSRPSFLHSKFQRPFNMSRDHQPNNSAGTTQPQQQSPNSLPNTAANQNGGAQNSSQSGSSSTASAVMNHHWSTSGSGNPLSETVWGQQRPNGSG
ncbi:hypothetical protein PMIN04_012836 [Paraphaeosphaeria minitans]